MELTPWPTIWSDAIGWFRSMFADANWAKRNPDQRVSRIL